MSQIKIAQLGNSDDLAVGEQVVAIGNALGYGQTVTSGWVSALNRTVSPIPILMRTDPDRCSNQSWKQWRCPFEDAGRTDWN